VCKPCTQSLKNRLFGAADNNRGTVKVHDGPDTDPERRNEPHVNCDFYVQGFNFHDGSGHLEFQHWRPTGDFEAVTPSGASLEWTGTLNTKGTYDYELGPYVLPSGHYRLEVYTNDGHPGSTDQFAKSKTFWVDNACVSCPDVCGPCAAPSPYLP